MNIPPSIYDSPEILGSRGIGRPQDFIFLQVYFARICLSEFKKVIYIFPSDAGERKKKKGVIHVKSLRGS